MHRYVRLLVAKIAYIHTMDFQSFLCENQWPAPTNPVWRYSMNRPLPNFPLNLTTANCHFGICCSNYIWLLFFLDSHCFSVIWTKTERAFFSYRSAMPTYSLTEALFVIRLLLLSAKITGCFFSPSNHHMSLFASEKLKPLCPILGEIHNWYCEFHLKYVTWLRTCSWLLEIW